ncbi:MAG: hypothetical protein ABH834_04940 [Candidatus Altiarchaeota archaeon]
MVNYPDYRAKTVVDLPDGKERWVEIGVAFQNRETISIRLDALPVNGKIVLVPIKEASE